MHDVWKSQKKSQLIVNIASEASYVYILSRQKLIKNAKNLTIFENMKLLVKQCYQTGHIYKDKIFQHFELFLS